MNIIRKSILGAALLMICSQSAVAYAADPDAMNNPQFKGIYLQLQMEQIKQAGTPLVKSGEASKTGLTHKEKNKDKDKITNAIAFQTWEMGNTNALPLLSEKKMIEMAVDEIPQIIHILAIVDNPANKGHFDETKVSAAHVAVHELTTHPTSSYLSPGLVFETYDALTAATNSVPMPKN